MAFPLVQDADTQNGVQTSNNNNWTATYPPNVVAGDVLLLMWATDGIPTVSSLPSGWSAIGAGRWVGASNACTLFAYFKRADGTESGNFTIAMAGTAEQGAWRCVRITGVHATSNPVAGTAATGTQAAGPTNLPNPPALTPSWGAEDTLWYALTSTDHGNTLINVFPANYTNTFSDNSGGSGGSCLGTCRRARNIATEDPGTFELSLNEQWVAQTIAFRPAPPAFVGVADYTTPVPVVTGSGTFVETNDRTGTGAYTIFAPTLVSSGTMVPNDRTGTGTYVAPVVQQVASGTVVPPQFTGNAVYDAPLPSLASSGLVTGPSRTGTAVYLLPVVVQTGSATYVPVPIAGTAEYTLPVVEVVASGTMVSNDRTGVGDYTTPVPVLTAEGTRTVPEFLGDAVYTIVAPTLESAGTMVSNDRTGDAAYNLPVVVQTGAAVYTPPAIAGTAEYLLVVPVVTASGTMVPNDRTGTADINVPLPVLTATGLWSVNPVAGDAVFDAPVPVLAASGTMVSNDRTGPAVYNLPVPVVTGSGTFVLSRTGNAVYDIKVPVVFIEGQVVNVSRTGTGTWNLPVPVVTAAGTVSVGTGRTGTGSYTLPVPAVVATGMFTPVEDAIAFMAMDVPPAVMFAAAFHHIPGPVPVPGELPPFPEFDPDMTYYNWPGPMSRRLIAERLREQANNRDMDIGDMPLSNARDALLSEVAAEANALTAAILSGTGSPEGIVTATPGRLYLRTDGGVGSTFYVKESGSGSTGWVAK